MAKTREIRRRIGSVRNIHKITHTMERVAQSKAMKLTGRYEHATSFRDALLRLLPESLGAALGSPRAAELLAGHPLAAVRPAAGSTRPGGKRVLLFCVTSSRGLCDGYNARVIQAARTRMAELAAEGREAVLSVAGRKGLAFFRYHNQPVSLPVADLDENVPFERLGEVAREIMRRFTSGDVDEVEVVSTRYRTKVHQEVTRVTLLPLRAGEPRGAGGHGPASAPAPAPAPAPDGELLSLVEPDRPTVLAFLAPLLVETEVFCMVLEAMLCEQAQRSMAMRSASDNADAMTKRLTRAYNRARQAQITNEMIEIISGSEGGRS